jgi:GIY-YIG catalytic domain
LRDRPAEGAPRIRKVSTRRITVVVAASELPTWIAIALESLAATKASPVDRGIRDVPPRPGLYAIHGARETWEELQLGEPPDDRPLYVGKSESSLAGRDVTTHFGFTGANRTTSITGSSTVRRSVAALLHDSHGLRGMPRNPEKPGHFANYGLSRKQDQLLSNWMRERLRLANWPAPPECVGQLVEIEHAILIELLPALNLDKVKTPWKGKIDLIRDVLRREARAWPTVGPGNA